MVKSEVANQPNG